MTTQTTTKTTTHPYAIKGLKMLETSDGVAFNATLLLNGKKVADIQQGGFGGPNEYHFTDRAQEAAFFAEAKKHHDGIEPEDAFTEDLIQDFEAIKDDKRTTKWAQKFAAECRAKNFKGEGFLLIRREGAVCAIAPIRATPTVEEQGAAALMKYKGTSWEKYNGVDQVKSNTAPRKTSEDLQDEIRGHAAQEAK